MFKSILDWFKHVDDESDTTDEHSPAQKAVAALLVEVSLADDEVTPEETQALPSLLAQHSQLTPQQSQELIEAATHEVDHAVSLHQFTQHINEEFDLEGKLELLTKLWLVALSDNHLDPHEDHMIRRIADLLHLRHSEFMQCKHKAQQLSK